MSVTSLESKLGGHPLRLACVSLSSFTSLIIFSVFLFLSHPFAVHAAGQYGTYEPDHSFGFQEWFTSGEAGWQISFPYDNTSSSGGTGRIESELNFKHIDSPITILRGGGRLNPEWTIDVSIGYGSITGGQGTDTDRDFPSTGGVIVFSESKEDISGDVRFWGIDLNYRKRYSDNTQSPWGLILGFSHYEDSLLITDGVQTISLPGWWWGGTNPPLGPFSQILHSTYDFSWDTLKVGGLYEAPLTEYVFFSSTLSAYPLVSYQGEGYWNLRNITFKHEATSGFGYEATLGIKYLFSDTTEFTAGYRYFYLKAQNGTDTTYVSGVPAGVSNLDWVEVTRQGAYAGLLFRF